MSKRSLDGILNANRGGLRAPVVTAMLALVTALALACSGTSSKDKTSTAAAKGGGSPTQAAATLRGGTVIAQRSTIPPIDETCFQAILQGIRTPTPSWALNILCARDNSLVFNFPDATAQARSDQFCSALRIASPAIVGLIMGLDPRSDREWLEPLARIGEGFCPAYARPFIDAVQQLLR